MDAKNYKYIWHVDGDIWPRNVSRIHTCDLFVTILFISPLWRAEKTHPSTKTSILLFWILNSHANFREKLAKALTARPQKPKLIWIQEFRLVLDLVLCHVSPNGRRLGGPVNIEWSVEVVCTTFGKFRFCWCHISFNVKGLKVSQWTSPMNL